MKKNLPDLVKPPRASGEQEAGRQANGGGPGNSRKPRENGGKYGFDDYVDVEVIEHEVEGIKVGDFCEHCSSGRYYYTEDRRQLEFTGGPILTVQKHIKKTLRCNRCGREKMSHKKIIKWGPQARSALVIHKIYGMPWYRMSRVQKLCGIPVAMSTLWQQFKGVWEDAGKYVVSKAYQLGAEGRLWCCDDTGMKILSALKLNEMLPESERRACHTTAICALYGDFKIVLYITANRYCRENWVPLLETRKNQDKVIIMTDASNQSLPKGEELKRVVSGVCLGGHARQKFKEVADYYPEECAYFLNLISTLYSHERACKDKSPGERLAYHQKHSQGIIDALYTRIEELFEKRLVEPNSILGKAMNYWLNHRDGLTAFLRVAGVPLDNNWSENALRMMAVYRKASLFFKTFQSAVIISDMFSLVATCEANEVNAFLYLNWLQENWKQVQANPEVYLPWNFKKETEWIAA